MSGYGRVKYYDPEDAGLIRLRHARANGHTHGHTHASARRQVPAHDPPSTHDEPDSQVSEEALHDELYHQVEPHYAPAPIEAARIQQQELDHALSEPNDPPVRGIAGQSCGSVATSISSSPEQHADRRPPRIQEPDLLAMNIAELASWTAFVYVPARVEAWLRQKRRTHRSSDAEMNR